ncbi:FIG138576: 3-oxoacyl-[ACP] synthase [hydrothermal vent metagenome]|uniref:FIG138576: 3-oxoacyl-[ACP] synthase n=1 Tax=hydrothermal vent metagenome TaxID=652676 RepID=A0A3B0VN94_9ZZZZ
MRRVVITGMAGISPLGSDWQSVSKTLKSLKNAVTYMHQWDDYRDLNTRLAAPVLDFSKPAHYKRKQVRSMGRVALLSTVAAENALIDADLLNDPVLQSGRMGISFGSSAGSTNAIMDFGNMLENKEVKGLNATTYIRMMSHTAPVNIGVFFGMKGRIITTSSACTSGSQGIGYAYETIKYGMQDVMIAGGAEELCPTEAAVFDTLFATSIKNDTPELSPNPFDKDRDGLVIGEGAGVLILEEHQRAIARGANIIAEIVGFSSNSDGQHITRPNTETMEIAMRDALKDANLTPDAIGYTCAHGTATAQGDVAESQATYRVFGPNMPFSSLKSYMGHTLGACGALEAWMSIEMMREGWFAPTVNLTNIDPQCGELDYIMSAVRPIQTDYIMTNNFAFGGINTSLIIKRL